MTDRIRNGARGGLHLTLTFCAALTAACARTVEVPPSDYDAPGHALSYRVHTRDGCTFFVGEFHVTDSTLVIDRLRDIPDVSSEPECLEGRVAPFAVALDNVLSVEKIRESDEFPLAMFLVFVVVLFVTTGFAIGYGS